MSFGGFLDTNTGSGGGRNITVTDIPYNNDRMPILPFGSISQPRLITTPTLSKSMFNSSGLSLALVSMKDLLFLFVFF